MGDEFCGQTDVGMWSAHELEADGHACGSTRGLDWKWLSIVGWEGFVGMEENWSRKDNRGKKMNRD